MLHQLDERYFYHRDRARLELEMAAATSGEAAEKHRQLALLHQARRESLAFVERLSTQRAGRPLKPISGTDKES